MAVANNNFQSNEVFHSEQKQMEEGRKGGERAPVMRHVLPDTIPINEMPSNFDPVRISHAVTLMTDPHSKDMIKRHMHIMHKIVMQYEDGFYLRDLVDILTILNACSEKCMVDKKYFKPMIEVINIVKKPFIKEKLSDDVAYLEVLKDAYAQIAFLLRLDHEDLRLQICATLLEVFLGTQAPRSKSCKKKAEKSDQDESQRRVPVEYTRYVFEECQVADTLVRALALFESAAVINILFQLLRHMTTNSTINCDLVVQCSGAYIICKQLPAVENKVDNGLYLATEILWNLLEYGDREEVTHQLSNQSCLKALHKTFLAEVPKTYSHHHRTVRNDLLAITNLIAKTNPDAPFIEVGFSTSIISLFTFSEVGSLSQQTKNLRFSDSEDDFEFKRLLLAVIMNLSENKSVIPLIREYKVLQAMLHYVAPVPEKHSTWLSSQFEEIQLQCLASLPVLAPLIMQDLTTVEVIETLSNFLNWCLASDQQFKGHGNSVYSTGGRGTKLAQTKYVIRLLGKILSTDSEWAAEILLENGLIEKYLAELTNLTTSFEQISVHEFQPKAASLPPESFILLDICCEILYSLATIMESSMDRKEILGQEGVLVLANILKIDPRKVCLGLGYTKLVLAAIEAIWNSVCGSFTNECYFLEQEGAFLLLDLLDKNTGENNSLETRGTDKAFDKSSQDGIKTVTLGCLLDLLENPKTLSHVLTWTGKNDIKIGKLLIKIWKLEVGKVSDDERDTDGMIISDVDNALNLPIASGERSPRAATSVSPQIFQVTSDLRAKLFGVFSKIGFTELVGLSAIDYVWLTYIEKYFDFQVSEVWKEITNELQEQQITPIGQDRQALEAISRISKDKVESTMSNQKSIYEAFEQQQLGDETMMYSDIKATRKQQEKLKLDFQAFVTRTSNHKALQKARKEQDTSIENSRLDSNIEHNKYFHTTTVDKLHVTVFSSQKVTSDNIPLVIDDSKPKTHPTTAASTRKAAYFVAE